VTTSQRLKAAIITALQANSPDPAISIVDAKIREEIQLPVLAVDIESVEPHSEALQDVERIAAVATLRIHIGDEEPGTLEGWTDSLEAIFADEELIKNEGQSLLKIFSFVYQGSVQAWDENILEITFSAESLCARLP
jgi:uncharacterized protein (DUF2344 family)